MTEIRVPVGDASVSAVWERPDDAWAVIAVTHGAGAGYDHPFLVGFSDALNADGVATLRFNLPYREAGRRMPGRPADAIAAWRDALRWAETESAGLPVLAAGKSYGGRMASMAVAEGMPAAALVYLGYPLHPPGKPEALRDEHLYGIRVPMLFLQGTKDPFATPELLDGVVGRIGASALLEWVEGGGHSFEVAGIKRTPAQVGASLAPSVAAFVRGHASGS
ncbi:alpha/beta family hydrolase [Cryobacterium sp. BB736]|uniref:alpha/beta hydrolase family protein n=1 Tax=Cryobacterium sp. BB736 TaxID=2746963 RepID=UPI001874639B